MRTKLGLHHLGGRSSGAISARGGVVAGCIALYAALAAMLASSGPGIACESGPPLWAKDPLSSTAVFKVGFPWSGESFIDTAGRVVARLRNTVAFGDFHDGLVQVRKSGEGTGFLRPDGSWAVPPKFDSAQDFSEGLAAVWAGRPRSWGYVDPTGKMAISQQFESCGRFRFGLAPATLDGTNWGYIDHAGRFLIQHQFLYAAEFAGRRARVVLAGDPCKMRVNYSCDTWIQLPTMTGKQAQHPELRPCRVVFIDDHGKVITPDGFEAARDFSQGLAAVYSNGKWGFIDAAGSITIGFDFQEVGPFSESIAAVKRDNKWGYVDEAGHFLIAPAFSWAGAFSEGVAVVDAGKGVRYIDRAGGQAVPGEYDLATPFVFGLAHVETHDRNGSIRMYIDRAGHTVYEYRSNQVQ